MTLEVFSNLNDSMIPWSESWLLVGREELGEKTGQKTSASEEDYRD